MDEILLFGRTIPLILKEKICHSRQKIDAKITFISQKHRRRFTFLRLLPLNKVQQNRLL